jgi:hypothetical protein
MKNVKLVHITIIALVILSLVFIACPPLEEDDPFFIAEVIVVEGGLDNKAWFAILDKIGRQGNYVILDLRDCEYVENNQNGGLVRVTLDDGTSAETYIAFDPFPAVSWGKDSVIKIILPDDARMIVNAVDKIDDPEDEEEIYEAVHKSAFMHFTNLRSVSGRNIEIIGNFAFAGNTTLEEVSFPRLGRTVTAAELSDHTNSMSSGFRVDIGDFAFMGCTNLKEISLNSAAVVGRYAFKDCTNLSSVNLPAVWKIMQNAFENCTSLVEVRFESATKIGSYAFKDCTNLKSIYFNANPERFNAGAHPIDDAPTGLNCTYDSIIFYPNAFSGCSALERIDVRRAWNVFFDDRSLEDIGRTLEIYLFDEEDVYTNTRGFGHPQISSNFLGQGRGLTLRSIFLYIPEVPNPKISRSSSNNIEIFIREEFPSVDVTVRHYR